MVYFITFWNENVMKNGMENGMKMEWKWNENGMKMEWKWKNGIWYIWDRIKCIVIKRGDKNIINLWGNGMRWNEIKAPPPVLPFLTADYRVPHGSSQWHWNKIHYLPGCRPLTATVTQPDKYKMKVNILDPTLTAVYPLPMFSCPPGAG